MTTEVLEQTSTSEIPAQTSVELTEGVEVEPKNPFDGKMFPHQGGLHVENAPRDSFGFRIGN